MKYLNCNFCEVHFSAVIKGQFSTIIIIISLIVVPKFKGCVFKSQVCTSVFSELCAVEET